MAVDTAAKRFSMFGFGGETFAPRRPDATNMDETEDRGNELFLYFGFADLGQTAGRYAERVRRTMAAVRHRRRRGF
jgi:hypothetical protein